VNVPASFENKVKVKLPCACNEGTQVGGEIAPLILNHVATWRLMVNFKHTDYTKAIFSSGMSKLVMVHINVISFTPVRKVWLSLHRFSRNSHKLNSII
jgi:uncharacterized membrane protein